MTKQMKEFLKAITLKQSTKLDLSKALKQSMEKSSIDESQGFLLSNLKNELELSDDQNISLDILIQSYSNYTRALIDFNDAVRILTNVEKILDSSGLADMTKALSAVKNNREYLVKCTKKREETFDVLYNAKYLFLKKLEK